MTDRRPKTIKNGDPISGIVALFYRCEQCSESFADLEAVDEHLSLDAGCTSCAHIYVRVERGHRVA